MDLGWLWCVDVGSSVVMIVPPWWGMLILGEALLHSLTCSLPYGPSDPCVSLGFCWLVSASVSTWVQFSLFCQGRSPCLYPFSFSKCLSTSLVHTLIFLVLEALPWVFFYCNLSAFGGGGDRGDKWMCSTHYVYSRICDFSISIFI